MGGSTHGVMVMQVSLAFIKTITVLMNSTGKLGHGNFARCRTPTLITHKFDGTPVVHVCCGADSSAVLTRAGRVFLWGRYVGVRQT